MEIRDGVSRRHEMVDRRSDRSLARKSSGHLYPGSCNRRKTGQTDAYTGIYVGAQMHTSAPLVVLAVPTCTTFGNRHLVRFRQVWPTCTPPYVRVHVCTRRAYRDARTRDTPGLEQMCIRLLAPAGKGALIFWQVALSSSSVTFRRSMARTTNGIRRNLDDNWTRDSSGQRRPSLLVSPVISS